MWGGDYSRVLIELAKMIMPKGDFLNVEACEIEEKKIYDVIVSHSVFHYFPDLEYAKKVIVKMIKKARKKIGIFDINDKAKEEFYHEERMKKLGRDEYFVKYKGLEHLFYEKKWFKDIANEFNLKVYIFDQNFETYINSKFRFNVIMEKN